MLKALTKTLEIHVSEPMGESFERLAKLHSVSVPRLVRALLWTSLNCSTNGHPNRFGHIHERNTQDNELEVALMMLDHFDAGFMACEDFIPGNPGTLPLYEDDGTPEQ